MKSDRAKYLVIGNSTAGVGAVEGVRRIDCETPIVLIAKEPYHTYSRPLVSYLLAGEIEEDRMYYRPPDFYEVNGVDARLGVEVTAVDAEARAACVANGGRVSFEKLLIAVGARPFIPEIKGLRGTSGEEPKIMPTQGVFTFATWDDAKRLGRYIHERRPHKGVVVGGGLIGIKAAEALRAQGLDVLVVELGERVLPLVLDERASGFAALALADAGVELQCGTTVERILLNGGSSSGVVLNTGRELVCDLVVLAIGVVPNTQIVRETTMETDQGILIDERCQTTVEGIYAAGDVAQGSDTVAGGSRPIPIFANAYRQGAVAGINMAGGDARVHVSFAMNSVEVFGLPTISVGLATASGEEYKVLTRADDATRTYRRIVLRSGRVVGGLFVGDIARAGILTGLIREGVDVSGIEDLLLSDEFGLLSLPAEYRKHLVSGRGILV